MDFQSWNCTNMAYSMTEIKLKGLQGGLEKGKIEEQKEYGFL
ncbi:MAG: hypothetical protein N2Z80_06445 [Hydrogenothermaceae bacterium]|nr:hypothetical protein [Hydrogenothermaceae bacterium]